MKIIKESDIKSIIILEDNEELEIKALKGNNFKLIVKCIDSIIHIDDNLENLNIRLEEEKAIAAMKKYLEQNLDIDEEKNDWFFKKAII